MCLFLDRLIWRMHVVWPERVHARMIDVSWLVSHTSELLNSLHPQLTSDLALLWFLRHSFEALYHCHCTTVNLEFPHRSTPVVHRTKIRAYSIRIHHGVSVQIPNSMILWTGVDVVSSEHQWLDLLETAVGHCKSWLTISHILACCFIVLGFLSCQPATSATCQGEERTKTRRRFHDLEAAGGKKGASSNLRRLTSDLWTSVSDLKCPIEHHDVTGRHRRIPASARSLSKHTACALLLETGTSIESGD